jgi:hypothetical protein
MENDEAKQAKAKANMAKKANKKSDLTAAEPPGDRS